MPSILVTGGAGFIGSAVVRRLLRESDEQVVVVDALTYAGSRANLPCDEDRLTVVHQEIGDRRALRALCDEHRPRAILNLAAETHVDRSIDHPSAFVHTNVNGVLELLEAAHGYWRSLPRAEAQAFRFVQVSTDEVYGAIAPPGRASVGDAYHPNSPYSASKAAADHLVRSYHVTFGLPTATVMLTNCYGPRQFPEKFIPLMICRAAAGESLPLYGDGRHVRQWLHADDAAAGLCQVAASADPGDTLHLAGNDLLENGEMLTRVCALVDGLIELKTVSTSLIESAPDRPGHDRRYALNDDSSRAKLDWRPAIKLEDGLRDTVAWVIENEDWVNHVLHRAKYHRERLGLGNR